MTSIVIVLPVAILSLTGCLRAAPQPELSSPAPTEKVTLVMPGPGEISLSGVVVSLDIARSTFHFKTEAFTLPNGKSSRLGVPKVKAVTLDKRTTLILQSGKPQSVTALKPGMRLVVIGKDLGAGKALPARHIAIGTISTGNVGAGRDEAIVNAPPTDLQKARSGFKTKVTAPTKTGEAPDTPTGDTFSLVHYPAAAGEMAAYLTPAPGDGKKFPAIIWITGGDCNSIGDVWSPVQRTNDQTAAAYRKAGIVMMFPSLRGGNDNPGVKEGFLGEVDDVMAAVRYLEKQKYVDANRIYLGGHSTGGTLALLVAECSARFRGVFAFGPVDDVAGYGADSGFLPFDVTDKEEVRLRSPGYWLASIQTPTWVFEGGQQPGNSWDLYKMKRDSTNPNLHFLEVDEANHFSILAPTNELIAKKIVRDTGRETNIAFYEDEVNSNFKK